MAKITLLIAGALVVLFCYPAFGQQPPACADRADVLKHLSDKYGEAPVGIGRSNSGIIVEIFTTADGRTWTAIATRADGVSCMIASGENWKTMLPPPPGGEDI
jgi:hypothetical protein